MLYHGDEHSADNMHPPYAWKFANAAAREAGVGVDSSRIGRLARQLDDNSLWMLVGTDPITWKAAGGGSSFESGTRMTFHQTTAPTGWTKDTSHNDKALRVVSGTVGSGGSVGFSTLFGRTATDAFTLTTAHMPSHGHSFSFSDVESGGGSGNYLWGQLYTIVSPNKSVASSVVSAGSGGWHSHGLDTRVKYIDLIIAQKD